MCRTRPVWWDLCKHPSLTGISQSNPSVCRPFLSCSLKVCNQFKREVMRCCRADGVVLGHALDIQDYMIQLLWSLWDKLKRRGQYLFNITDFSTSPEQNYTILQIHTIAIQLTISLTLFTRGIKIFNPSLLSTNFLIYLRLRSFPGARMALLWSLDLILHKHVQFTHEWKGDNRKQYREQQLLQKYAFQTWFQLAKFKSHLASVLQQHVP